MALLSTPDLLTLIKSNAQPGTALYNQLDRLRQTVESDAKSYIKWPLEANDGVGQGNWFDYYDGKGYPDIVTYMPYVANVSALYLDQLAYGGQNTTNYAPFASTTLQTAGINYMVVNTRQGLAKGGQIRYLGATNNVQGLWPSDMWLGGRGGITYQPPPGWPVGYQNIKVVYDFGFQPSTAITGISWSTNVATMTFASGVVCWPGEGFTILNDDNWAGEYRVLSVASPFTSVTFMSSNKGTYGGAGSADFVPGNIKMAIAEAVSLMRNKIIRGVTVTSETLGDYNYGASWLDRPAFGDIKQIFSSYKDPSVGIGLF
jgi:hypothetical protein